MTEESKKNNEETTNKESQKEQQKNVFEEFGEQVEKFATRTMESIKKTIDRAMDSRNTVLSIRVNEEANEKLGMLVEAGIFKSRSESAAFLIEEGIKKQESLFRRITERLEQINKLKDELKNIVSDEMGETGPDDSTKKEKKK